MKKNLVLQKETSPALFGDIDRFFLEHGQSESVELLRIGVNTYCFKTMNPDTIEVDKKEAVAQKKEIEYHRSVINDIANKIKTLNQDIYKPILDKLEAHKKKLISDYDAWDREQKRKAAERQAELDRIRNEEISRLKAEAEKKRKAAIEKGEPDPEIKIEEPIRIVATEVATKKSVLKDEVCVNIKDSLRLANFLLKKGKSKILKEGKREDLFKEIYSSQLISPIASLIRQNQGNLELVQELENAGVDFTGSRGYGIW